MHDNSSADAIRAIALPLMQRSLESCRRLLVVAERHTSGASATDAALLASRLAPDMLCLAHQVRVLADSLEGACALLNGDGRAPAAGWVFNRDESALGAPERNFGEAIARIDAALGRVRAITPATPIAAPDATLSVARPGHVRHFVVDAFVWRYVLPNAGFHAAMVHALLRANGVPVGKAVFEGPPAYAITTEVDAGAPCSHPEMRRAKQARDDGMLEPSPPREK